jgi:sulfotransferase family protein
MSTLKVFGIGLSRTGSTSLHAASVILRLSALHYPSRPAKRWLQGDYSAETTNPFNVITDIPTGVYFEELDKTHPHARFILTIRDVDSWLNSFEAFLSRTKPSSPDTLTRDVIRVACYGTTRFNRERMAGVYLRHNDRVQKYFKYRSSDLLILELGDDNSWKRLCDFLDLTPPKIPYPHLRAPGIGELRWVLPEEINVKRRALMQLLYPTTSQH